MKILKLIFSIVISFIALWFFASFYENGDVNAISMYYVVYFFPILLIIFLNDIYTNIIQKTSYKKTQKIILTIIPLLILIGLTFINIPLYRIPAKYGLFGVGLSNLFLIFIITITCNM